MSERVNNNEMSEQQKQAWVEQFNAVCRSVYIDLNDEETLTRVFVVPKGAVAQQKDAMVKPNPDKDAYTLLQETDEFTAAQRAETIFVAVQNNRSIYVCAPGSNTPRKITFGENLKPVLGKEVTVPGAAPTPPAKPSGWKRFANWLTRGSAYKDDIKQYENDLTKYHNDLAAHMEQVDDFHSASAINGLTSMSRNYGAERAYQQRVDFERQREELQIEGNTLITEGAVIKNSYTYFFAPDMNALNVQLPEHGQEPLQLDAMRGLTYQVPKDMSVQQATALAFAASISEKAMTNIGNSDSATAVSDELSTNRTMMVENYLSRPNERNVRQVYLDNAIINGRKMMPELLEAIQSGNLESAADVLRSAITGVLVNRRSSNYILRNTMYSYGAVLEGLKSCLDLPGMKEAVNLSEKDMKQMDAIIGLSRLEIQRNAAVQAIYTTDYAPDQLEARNEALLQVMAVHMMELDFIKEMKDIRDKVMEPIDDAVKKTDIAIEEAKANEEKKLNEMAQSGKITAEEKERRLKELRKRSATVLGDFTVLLGDDIEAGMKVRPLTPMEEAAARDADVLKLEYLERAKKTPLYQELSQETDTYRFRKMAFEIVENYHNDRFSRESISENELAGRQQPHQTMQRSAQPTKTNDLSKNK